MVLKAALKNERHPEYGVVTIPFPRRCRSQSVDLPSGILS